MTSATPQSTPQLAPQLDLSSLPLTLSMLQQRRQQLERCQQVIDQAEAELARLELRLQIEINMRLLKLDVEKYENHHILREELSKLTMKNGS